MKIRKGTGIVVRVRKPSGEVKESVSIPDDIQQEVTRILRERGLVKPDGRVVSLVPESVPSK